MKKLITKSKIIKTDEDMNFIYNNYMNMSNEELANHFKCKKTVISNFLTLNKLKRNNYKITKDSYKFVKENYKKMTIKEMSEKLGCHKSTINRIKKKLNLSKKLGSNIIKRPDERFVKLAKLGFSNYAISNYAQVINIKKRISLKPFMTPHGYLNIKIFNDKKERKIIYLARLVAKIFVKNPDPLNKTQVNHKDGNKKNNYYKNLEWTTQSENIEHAYINGLNHGGSKYKIEDIEKICKLLEEGYSNAYIRNNYNFPESLIYKLKTKKIWKGICEKFNY